MTNESILEVASVAVTQSLDERGRMGIEVSLKGDLPLSGWMGLLSYAQAHIFREQPSWEEVEDDDD